MQMWTTQSASISESQFVHVVPSPAGLRLLAGYALAGFWCRQAGCASRLRLDVLRNSGAQATTCGHTLRFPRHAVRLQAGYFFNLRMEFFCLPSGISEMPSSPVSVALEADQSAFQHYNTGLAFLATTAVLATSL